MIRQHVSHDDLEGSRKALIRAAKRAADTARQYNQPLVLWEDGKIVKVMPDDLPPLPDMAPIKEQS